MFNIVTFYAAGFMYCYQLILFCNVLVLVGIMHKMFSELTNVIAVSTFLIMHGNGASRFVPNSLLGYYFVHCLSVTKTSVYIVLG